MSQTEPFDTIWRAKLHAKLVQIPQSQYRNYVPRVDVFPLAVHDPYVVGVDMDFQDAIAAAVGIINSAVSAVKPIGVKIPMRQLVDQLAPVLSSRQTLLRVFSGHKVLKEIPIQPDLLEQCRIIRRVLLERLLLFEDMAGALPAETVDDWTHTLGESHQSISHVFRAGGKADALVHLSQLLLEKPQKVVVFVRNILVCEAIGALLAEKSIRAAFVHGQVETAERKRRLDAFRRGDTQVLVVTRQLFGRGFDLPEAETGVFYSPKENERTMWQEMLRIRSTVRHAKRVFVLFYAWTTEASKLERLIKGMMRTNASWQGHWFCWIYSERNGLQGETATATEEVPRGQEPEARSKATRNFIRSVEEGIDASRKQQVDTIVQSLSDIAERTGFSHAWPTELVKSLLFQLSEAIVYFGKQKQITAKKIWRQLSRVLHPDMHPRASGVEKQFWHELFVALGRNE